MPNAKVAPAGQVMSRSAENAAEEKGGCAQVCDGEAGCLANCLLWPFVLLWNGLRLYVFECCKICAGRAYRVLCYPFCSCCWVYNDKSFCGEAAHGAKDAELDWVRATKLPEGGGRMKLYSGKVEAADLVQGAVGDCWLVAALASAAEQPVCIRNAILTPEFNPRGRYRVRIFDGQTKKWVKIDVDDKLPCGKGGTDTHFMTPNGDELWAVIMEKAFAKFCGSYANLDGGLCAWAWRAITGDIVFSLRAEAGGKGWERLNFYNTTGGGAGKEVDKRSCQFTHSGERFSNDEAWVLIQRYLRGKSLVAASGGKETIGGGKGGGLNGEDLDSNGLVATHAYSVLDARELAKIPGLSITAVLGKTKLIRLRNPWGKFEWTGAWGDGSPEWESHPAIKRALKPQDGTRQPLPLHPPPSTLHSPTLHPPLSHPPLSHPPPSTLSPSPLTPQSTMAPSGCRGRSSRSSSPRSTSATAPPRATSSCRYTRTAHPHTLTPSHPHLHTLTLHLHTLTPSPPCPHPHLPHPR